MNYADLDRTLLDRNSSYDAHSLVRRAVLDEARGIVAIIAVHSTALGPALGGCRMRKYASEDEALTDVLRLSRGMTYKNAMAGLPLGGGKAVIIGDWRADKSEGLMEEMGEAVESLQGRYVTAEDSGTGEEDMVAMSRRTKHVTGLPPEFFEDKDFGELGGNPSPLTALGVYVGMRAAVKHRHGHDSLSGMTVAVQGLGAVGFELCKLLAQDGVKLVLTDVDAGRIATAKAAFADAVVVEPDAIFDADADIFAPCALGGILNDQTIPRLKAQIVAGAANNQLLEARHDRMLMDRHILYVPDYVINAGGVICVAYEYFRASGYNPQDIDINRQNMVAHVERIGATVTDILGFATVHRTPPGEAADKIAEAKVTGAAPLSPPNPETPASPATGGGTTLVQ